MDPQATAVVDFWFGPLDGDGRADEAHRRRWFGGGPAFDQEIRERFLGEVEAALAGQRSDWRRSGRGTLAYILILDQFTRNLFRGTPRMFAGDPLALAAAEVAVAGGADREMPPDLRAFIYMPFMHSEDLARQHRSVELFTALLAEAPPAAREGAQGGLDYAIRHRDIVARFARFPHRNAMLGRTSTAEEVEFLAGPGSSF